MLSWLTLWLSLCYLQTVQALPSSACATLNRLKALVHPQVLKDATSRKQARLSWDIIPRCTSAQPLPVKCQNWPADSARHAVRVHSFTSCVWPSFVYSSCSSSPPQRLWFDPQVKTMLDPCVVRCKQPVQSKAIRPSAALQALPQALHERGYPRLLPIYTICPFRLRMSNSTYVSFDTACLAASRAILLRFPSMVSMVPLQAEPYSVQGDIRCVLEIRNSRRRRRFARSLLRARPGSLHGCHGFHSSPCQDPAASSVGFHALCGQPRLPLTPVVRNQARPGSAYCTRWRGELNGYP